MFERTVCLVLNERAEPCPFIHYTLLISMLALYNF